MGRFLPRQARQIRRTIRMSQFQLQRIIAARQETNRRVAARYPCSSRAASPPCRPTSLTPSVLRASSVEDASRVRVWTSDGPVTAAEEDRARRKKAWEEAAQARELYEELVLKSHRSSWSRSPVPRLVTKLTAPRLFLRVMKSSQQGKTRDWRRALFSSADRSNGWRESRRHRGSRDVCDLGSACKDSGQHAWNSGPLAAGLQA